MKTPLGKFAVIITTIVVFLTLLGIFLPTQAQALDVKKEGNIIYFGDDKFSGQVEVFHMPPFQPNLGFDQDDILLKPAPEGVSDEAVDARFYEDQKLSATLYFRNNSEQNMKVSDIQVHTFTADYSALTDKANAQRLEAGKTALPVSGENKTVTRVKEQEVLTEEIKDFELLPDGNTVTEVRWTAPNSQHMRLNEAGEITGFGQMTVVSWKVEGKLYGMTSAVGWGSADAYPDMEAVKLTSTEAIFKDTCEGKLFCVQLNGYRGWSELELPDGFEKFLDGLYNTDEAGEEAPAEKDDVVVDYSVIYWLMLPTAALVLITTILLGLIALQAWNNEHRYQRLKPQRENMDRLLNA